jgi:pilus assembly protein FimV
MGDDLGDDSGEPGTIDLDLSGLPGAATMSDTELPQNIIGQSSDPIDPAQNPFPTPDKHAGVDEEFGREVAQVDSTSSVAADADEFKPLNRFEDQTEEQAEDRTKDRPDDDNLFDFASNETSELDFKIDLEDIGAASAKGTDDEPDELNLDDLIQLDIGETRLQTNSLVADDNQGEQSMDAKSDLPMEGPDDTSGAEQLRTVPREIDFRDDASRDDNSREDVTRNFGVIDGGSTADDTSGNGGAEDTATKMDMWDETATKLDLAQAYLNMGDKAGARSIIDEVFKEGSPAQKNQAAELKAQLA